MREEFVRSVLFLDNSFVDEKDAGADLSCKAHFVRDDSHGHTEFRQFLHDFKDFADHFRVKGGGGLIKEHHIRVHGHGADDGNTLFLSAGKTGGVGICLVQKVYTFKELYCFFVCLLLLHESRPDRGQSDVALDSHIGEEIKVLEDHAHFAADGIDVSVFVGQINASKIDFSGCGLLQEVETAEEGGFTGTGGTDDDDLFSPADFLGDPVEDDMIPKGFYEVLHTDQNFAVFSVCCRRACRSVIYHCTHKGFLSYNRKLISTVIAGRSAAVCFPGRRGDGSGPGRQADT